MAVYTYEHLVARFSATTLAKGETCRQQGHVRELSVQACGLRLVGRVTGSQNQVYRVLIRIIPHGDYRIDFESSCTCPLPHPCKHVMAVLLEALQDSRSSAGSAAYRSVAADVAETLRKIMDEAQVNVVLPAAVPVRAPAPAVVPAAVPVRAPAPAAPSAPLAQWLQRLGRATEQDSVDEYPPQVRDRLLYVLEPPTQRPVSGTVRNVLTVKVMVVRLLKDGSYGPSRAYGPRYSSPRQQPQFVTPADNALLRTLGQQEPIADQLAGAEGADLLKRLLATGRCHWHASDQPPLQLGEPRPGGLQWTVDEHGHSRLTLAVEPPARVISLEPLWYIAPEQALAGPITLDLPPRLALELADAPALAPAELPHFQVWLQAHPELPVPPPPVLEVETVELNPAPVLSLYSRQLQPYYRDSGVVDGARVGFDYGGEIIRPDDARSVFTHYRDDKLLQIVRQPAIEAARVRRLSLLGLQRLGKFGDNYLIRQQGLADDYGLKDEQAWVEFMAEGVPRLRDEGWRVELEPDFRYDLEFPDAWYGELDESSRIDWFGLALGVEIGGEQINLLPALVDFLRQQPAGTLQPWLNGLGNDDSILLTLPRRRRLAVPAQRLRAILQVLIELYEEPELDADGRLELPRIQAVRLAELEARLYGEPLRWQGGEALRALADRLHQARIPEQATVPTGLQTTLRPYQERGLAWLEFLWECELGGILADDMGLGKTVETLAWLLAAKEQGRLDRPSLIVAPTSVLSNWRRETARFAPALRVLTLHGPQRRALFAQIPEHDIVLSTYPLLPRDSEALLAHDYHVLILDEAQAIKNPKAQAGLVARSIKARQRLCLTGTPMENHLGELWSLFDFLMPGLLGDERQFRQWFRRPIEQLGDPRRREVLTRRITPFLLRRTKEQVATDLPPKTEIVRTVELHGTQRDLYESIRVAMQDKIRQAVQKQGLARSRIVILDALLRLRQVCCDPRLVKLEAARRFGLQQSAKLELLLELLTTLREEDRRILLFSQFTSMLALIETELARLHIPFVKLTGSTQDRATPVERFQRGEIPLFLISLKAGGTGLNLTAADSVIHYDPWWNPAVEDQATDRAHRIGQDKPVFVYKLYTEGTVEERIRELQGRKRALLAGVLDTDTETRLQWTEQDLDFLLAPLAAA